MPLFPLFFRFFLYFSSLFLIFWQIIWKLHFFFISLQRRWSPISGLESSFFRGWDHQAVCRVRSQKGVYGRYILRVQTSQLWNQSQRYRNGTPTWVYYILTIALYIYIWSVSWRIYNHWAWADNVAYPWLGAMRRPELWDEREVRFSHAFFIFESNIKQLQPMRESRLMDVVAIMQNR